MESHHPAIEAAAPHSPWPHDQSRSPRIRDGNASQSWRKMQDEVLAMVDSTLHECRGEPDRVYLTGLSFGGPGRGTWR